MSYNIILPSTGVIEVFGGSLGRQRLVEAIGERMAVDAGDGIPGLYRFGRIRGGESLGEETGQNDENKRATSRLDWIADRTFNQ